MNSVSRCRSLIKDGLFVDKGDPKIVFLPLLRAARPNIGFAAGEFEIPSDFDELPDSFMAAFER